MSNRATLIFDLDDTLVDTYHRLIVPLERTALASLGFALTDTERRDALDVVLHARRADPARVDELVVARFPDFGPRLVDVRASVFADFAVDDLVTMPDASPVLDDLGADHDLILLSEGVPDIQQRKIAVTGLARHFDAIVVARDNGEKDRYIRDHARDHRGDAIVLIGNRLDKELACAAGVSATTVWMRHGEGCEMQPATVGVAVDFTIDALAELPTIVRRRIDRR